MARVASANFVANKYPMAPSTVHVPITPTLRAAIADAMSSSDADADSLAALGGLQNSGVSGVAVSSFGKVARALRRCGVTTPLAELLRGARLGFPSEPAKQPSEALLRRREYLQRRAEAVEYQKMVGGVSHHENDRERVGALLPGLSVGADMLVAMFSVSIVCFMAASTMGFSYQWRLAAGLLGAIVIMFVEMVLFVIRQHHIDETKGRGETAAKKRR